MPIDPALLLFAGQFLQNAGGGTGFGQSLGGSLQAAGQALQFRQDAQRQQRQDLLDAAESSINIRAALGELQAQQKARADQQAYLESLPEELRPAAAVAPQASAQAQIEANAPLTQYQQQQVQQGQQGLELDRQKLQLAQEAQTFNQDLDLAKLALASQPAKPKLSDVSSLRSQYIRESTDFKTIADAYTKILNTSANAAGDVSLIFSYMKMLDPTSVVRESEQATARNAAGVPERVRTLYNRVLFGDSLSPEQRREFKQESGVIYEGQFQRQQQVAQGFQDIASRGEFDPKDILDAVPIESPGKLKGMAIDRRIKAMGLSLSDVDETAQKHGLTHEQVLDELERLQRQRAGVTPLG